MPEPPPRPIEFRVLGGISALRAGEGVDVGPARQQCVLAALLVDVNTAVSVDELIERVWADRAPHRPRETLHTYFTRLRRALIGASITRYGNSYQLVVDEDAVDLHRFRRLTSAAHASLDDVQAHALLTEALRLWRGEPFAGLDTPWLHGVRSGLHKEHTAATLDHTDLGLRLGEHASMLATLAAQAQQYPLDERLAGQLMLALYRSGRQADALTQYSSTRQLLADELGVDPSNMLQRLHHQILTSDAELTSPARGAAPTPVAPVPRQLPAAPGTFTGRAEELRALSAALMSGSGEPAMPIAVIAGAGGIGKTWLALHWAHQNLHRFPDGQLYVNLRGFDPSGLPTAPHDAVRGFLDALGASPSAIPVELDSQIGLYRSMVADKRMLIVIDNAADAAQVTPLLPGGASCTVLVTSRDRLTSLITAYGAQALPVEVLPGEDARALLAMRLGAQRVAAEPDAVAALLASCSGLPLALSIVAGRAQQHPEFPLSALAHELHDTTNRLAALDEDNTNSVRTVLSWSYATLTPQHATTFALLGLAPGPDISRAAASTLTDQPGTHTALRALERSSLIQQPTPNRYRMHDLIRLYAQEQAHERLSAAEREAALRRLIGFYARAAVAGDGLLAPHRELRQLDLPGAAPPVLHGVPGALAWFDAEHANLLAAQQLAAQHGWHDLVWALAWGLTTFHQWRGHLLDDVATWEAALAAADHVQPQSARSLAHRLLGYGYAVVGRHEEALAHLTHAFELAVRAEDRTEQAETHHLLARIWELRGDDTMALVEARAALALWESLEQPVERARELNAVGWYAARTGDYEQARIACQDALVLLRKARHVAGEANTLDSLGYIAHGSGQYLQAVAYYQQALALFHRLGNAFSEANTLDRLAQTYVAGDHRLARVAWERALRLYEAHHRNADVDRIERALAGLEDHDTPEDLAGPAI